ncbi:Leucine-rich repeat-containing protein 34 [Linnemannia gamsii]|uniref:Leucine-rich repeat-containing protein 34 n=1 Tax=Linnemannia gamsii TaxID=64522 RepID=A0ABQ7JN37_9FUNG|nr:Leucine-rich repeat-containing protein 34 [Linnemannia gamsii]
MAWGGGNTNTVDAWCKRLRDNDTTFTSLHILSFRRVTTAELGLLFDALSTNTTLKELYASGHSLDHAASKKLATALEQNSTLERLNIGNDRMGSNTDVVKALAEGLAKNKGLVRLDMENKGLGGHAGGDDGEGSVKALAEALEKNRDLQELNLARNKLADQDIDILCKALAHNKGLKVLDLSLNSFGEHGTRAIATLLAAGNGDAAADGPVGLKEIDLSDNELTEEGGMAIGQALKTNKTLQRLRMSSSMDPPLPVEEGDEDKLQWDHDLATLNKPLSPDQEAEIRSDGDAVLETLAESLKDNNTLQEIWMDYCNISSVGVTFLAEALRSNQGLTTVRMRNNRIGNRGARAFGAALTPASSSGGYNSTLKNLELGSNKVGVLGWHGLVGASSLESLGLYENGINILHEAIDSHLLSSSSPSSTAASSLNAAIPNGVSTAHHVLEKLAHLDVGCNGISREDFTQLGVSLIKGALPSLIRLEIAGNGDRSQAPQDPGHGDDDDDDNEGGGDSEPRPDDEQAAWERVTDRIEEARPGLVIHWKGAGAMQQQS